MSSVLRRFRKETELQFLVNAQELQVKLTKFLMSEKNLPKKYRLLIAQGMINKVDELLDNLNFANTLFPTTKQEFLLRQEYQIKAICNCWQLHNKIVRMILCVENIKLEKLEEIADLLESSERLIKKWKKTDKERFKKLFVES